MTGPNVLSVAFNSLRALRVERPVEGGQGTFDHEAFAPLLIALVESGLAGVDKADLDRYLGALAEASPGKLTPTEQLAFWINAYNAHSVDLGLRAHQAHKDSVLDLHSAFESPVIEVAGEKLSLIDIEHGKIRRFSDPRIHGALVCGSLSCPTLRPEPFVGSTLQEQLNDQMAQFLRLGGAVVDRDAGVLSLSRVFRWYGSDFVRPRIMPLLFPTRMHRVANKVGAWMDPVDRQWIETAKPDIEVQSYDWGVGCSVA